MQKEVSEIGSYFSILKVIAGGQHKLGKIATALNQPQTSLSKYLSVLTDLDLLERQVPITEENPEKSKMGLYFIKDSFNLFIPIEAYWKQTGTSLLLAKSSSLLLKTMFPMYMKIYVEKKYGIFLEINALLTASADGGEIET